MEQTLQERLRSGTRSHDTISLGGVLHDPRCLEAADALDLAEKALEDAILQIEYLHCKFQETGSGNAVLSQTSAALKALKAIKGVERIYPTGTCR